MGDIFGIPLLGRSPLSKTHRADHHELCAGYEEGDGMEREKQAAKQRQEHEHTLNPNTGLQDLCSEVQRPIGGGERHENIRHAG